MPRIAGWRLIYDSKPTLGHSIGNPLVLLWEHDSTSDEVKINRYYEWTDGKNIRYPDDEEIPAGKDRWVLVTTEGESYYATRSEAKDAAMSFMRSYATEDEIPA